ncbi:MAG TPA: thiamine phosphate synthase [Blastocatellia bacterium]|nr:thiamine phosphate synthase [Blastocatellia bacterium]
MILPKLYAITDTNLSNCSQIEIVERLLAGGACLLQLRDKEASAREMFEAAQACLQQTRAVGATLIINDRVDVAMAADADGVHLGQDDLTVAEARALLGPDKIIGISTHSLAQAEAALATSANYLAVGPIFSTTTKTNPDPVVGLELLRQVRALTSLPLVAIGGITLENVRDVIAAGADSVAVISALYPLPDALSMEKNFAQMMTAKPDIEGRTRAFLQRLAA